MQRPRSPNIGCSCSLCFPLLALNAGCLDYLRPFAHFGGSESTKLLRGSARRIDADFGKTLFHIGELEYFVDLAIELADYRCGHVRRREKPRPLHHFVA